MSLEQLLETVRTMKDEPRHWIRELYRNLYDVTVYQSNNRAQSKKARDQQILGYINRFNTINNWLASYGYKVTISIKRIPKP